jgi:hypothetical protein
MHAAIPPLIRVIKSKRMRWSRDVARMGEMRNVYNSLVGKPVGDRLLGRHSRRWEDNIRMDVRERGWEVVNWIHLAHDRDKWRDVVKTVMNLRVP